MAEDNGQTEERHKRFQIKSLDQSDSPQRPNQIFSLNFIRDVFMQF